MDSEIPSKISSAPNDFDKFFAIISDMVDSIPFEAFLGFAISSHFYIDHKLILKKA
jgi:hypothetical protein